MYLQYHKHSCKSPVPSDTGYEGSGIHESQTAGDPSRTEGSSSWAASGGLKHILLRWFAKQLWQGEPQSAKGIVRISSPTPAVRSSWKQQVSGLGSENTGDLSQQESLVLIVQHFTAPSDHHGANLDFFLFGLCRQMIRTRPDNLWVDFTSCSKKAAAAFTVSSCLCTCDATIPSQHRIYLC